MSTEAKSFLVKAALPGIPPFWFGAAAGGLKRGFNGVSSAAKRAGQVTVELLLVLPVFMLMLFFIMEMGNMAYQTILIHHCAYELARIGSLVAGPPGGSSKNISNMGLANQKMRSTLNKMFRNSGQIQFSARSVTTGRDPQPLASANPHVHTNDDLMVTLTYPAQLIFPGSSYFLADQPRSRRIRKITVRVRVPIEKPVFQ